MYGLMGLAFLGAAIGSSKRMLGGIPAPSYEDDPERWETWAKITFAPGTPVKLVRPPHAPKTTINLLLDPQGAGYDEYLENIEEGMRGVATGRIRVWRGEIWVKIVDARDKWGTQRADAIGETVAVRHHFLVPLVDNWKR